MANTNLLKPFAEWTKQSASGTTDMDSFAVSSDGTTLSFTVTDESSYVYLNIATNEIKGHTLKLNLESMSSTDSNSWFQIRLYNADQSDYTSIDKKEADGDYSAALPLAIDIAVPSDCGRLRIVIRHEYASSGISPGSTITVKNITLYDTYTESLTALNFHKVLKENLPQKVDAGTQHIFFTTDGTNVEQFIATKEGYLIPVRGTSSSSGNSGEVYSNAYTQQWIDERKADIVSFTKTGHCIVFAVATDIHVRIEDGDAGRYNQVRDFLMVAEQLPIDYICCLGDIMSYCQDYDQIFEPRIEKVKDIFNQARCPWFCVRGNHDYNSDDYNPGGNTNIKEFNKSNMNDYLITNTIWNRSITSQMPEPNSFDIVFDETHHQYGYFYVDDFAHKHRMIFLSTYETHETETGMGYPGNHTKPDCFISGVKTEHQMNWIMNKALDMSRKTDWTVSFFSHMIPYSDVSESDCSEFHGYGGNNSELLAILKAFANGTSVNQAYNVINTDTHDWKIIQITKDFSSQGPIAVTGFYGGHIHDDCDKSVEGIHMNVSTCTCSDQRTDWANDPTPSKIPPERNSSNYAMSMNIFMINTDTRIVKKVKLGSKRDNTNKESSDLTWSY